MLGSLIQRLSLATPLVVIPAKAGIQPSPRAANGPFWTPTFAGMTLAVVRGCSCRGRSCVTSVSIVLLLLCPALAAAQSVFAAASLSSALTELAAHYEGMRLSVASSSTLAKQIAAGAPADIYFSANAEWMDYLQTRQHIEQDTRGRSPRQHARGHCTQGRAFHCPRCKELRLCWCFRWPLGPRRPRSRTGRPVRPSSPRSVGLVVGTQNPHRTRARRPRRLGVRRARRVRRGPGVRDRRGPK